MKHLKALKDNEFTNNKLYYYQKSTGTPASRFYGQSKVPIRPIVYSGSPLYSLIKYTANVLKVYVKDENNNTKNSKTFFYPKR